jgi:hypothetical protein
VGSDDGAHKKTLLIKIRAAAWFAAHAPHLAQSIEPGEGARDKDHGWYPVTQKAADALFAKALRP